MKVKRGTNRIVILVGKYAFKFPNIFNGHLLFLYGCYSNYSERDFCKKFRDMPEFYNLVAPSLFCSWFGLLEVQVRCEEVLSISDSDLRRLESVNGESKPINYGTYKNNLVCVDYK